MLLDDKLFLPALRVLGQRACIFKYIHQQTLGERKLAIPACYRKSRINLVRDKAAEHVRRHDDMQDFMLQVLVRLALNVERQGRIIKMKRVSIIMRLSSLRLFAA